MKGYIPQTTGKYKKDYRRCEKRGWDMKLLDDVVEKLCRGEPLEESNYEHTLSGDWEGCWECHIKGDWVLVHQFFESYLILRRTGSHSDVYG